MRVHGVVILFPEKPRQHGHRFVKADKARNGKNARIGIERAYFFVERTLAVGIKIEYDAAPVDVLVIIKNAGRDPAECGVAYDLRDLQFPVSHRSFSCFSGREIWGEYPADVMFARPKRFRLISYLAIFVQRNVIDKLFFAEQNDEHRFAEDLDIQP